MGYKLHPPESKDDAAFAAMLDEPDKEVRYLSVVLLVFQLLDTGVTVKQLSRILDQIADTDEEVDSIVCLSVGRARLAVELVDAFLLKDSYTRATQD